MRFLLSSVLVVILSFGATAQKMAPRTEFISYDIRKEAEDRSTDISLDKSAFYLPLSGAGAMEVEIPYKWLDRDVFVQVSGIASYTLAVNGVTVGRGEDSRLPTQFYISERAKDGVNKIVVTPDNNDVEQLEGAMITSSPKVFIFSQPKVRVEDFKVEFAPDSTAKHGIFDLTIALSNSYNFPETVTVGYDIYAPDGTIQYYDFRDITIAGQGRDTIRFSQPIWRTNDNMWSAQTPLLYYGMLTLKRGPRMEEYIPYRIGFGTTQLTDGKVVRNGKPIAINAARYNSSADAKTTAQQIATLKKQGINTILPDYPQPKWFYDLCDEVGMYVIDQANINTRFEADNRKVGGALSNNPIWERAFVSRTEAMYGRVKNHSCVIGWSLAGAVGNGYNMYKSYQWLKSVDEYRAVVFNDAQGEWNSDMEPIRVVDAAEILTKAATATGAKKR